MSAPWSYRADRTVADVNGLPLLRFYADRATPAERAMVAAAPELLQLAEQFERVADFELRKKTRENPDDDEGMRLQALNLAIIRATLAKARGEQ